MKKNLILMVCALLLTGLSSCSTDDNEADDMDNIRQLVLRNDGSVLGGEVYGDRSRETDTSDPLAVFFREELHNPRWDGYGNEHKTFFEQGNYDDEKCIMINSRQEFQNAYMGTKTLPEVDFDTYTLIIGRTWGNDSSWELALVALRDDGDNYELETKLYHHVDWVALAAITTIHYWRLYPKRASKNIVIKRTVENVKD